MRPLWRMVPQSVKRTLRDAVQGYRRRVAIWRLSRLKPGQRPPVELLTALHRAWGNEGYSANLPYLVEVARQASIAEGSILECGSGVTTILLGMMAGRRGVTVDTLEHSPEWWDRVARVLTRHRIPGIRLHLAPIVDHVSYAWYQVPASLPGEFRLVICDGPPGDTKGGRYGLLPLLSTRLPPGAVILLDDATRPVETDTRRRWRATREMFEQLHESPDRAYSLLILGACNQDAGYKDSLERELA